MAASHPTRLPDFLHLATRRPRPKLVDSTRTVSRWVPFPARHPRRDTAPWSLWFPGRSTEHHGGLELGHSEAHLLMDSSHDGRRRGDDPEGLGFHDDLADGLEDLGPIKSDRDRVSNGQNVGLVVCNFL